MDDFDYVIVGAGTAGCVLANRLSADRANSVLLLEAGGSDRRFWVRVPIGYARTFRDPAVNWMYQSQPEPALDGRRSYWPRGKVLGGSSSINAMAYVRGLPRDYDAWERMGNAGWGWRQVEPLFRLAEDHAGGASLHHGALGPLRVTDITHQVHPLCSGFIEAARAAGLGVTPDFNGASAQGVGIYQINTRNGLRESASTAFLRPVLGRANLTLHQHAHATRIELRQRRATGVAYRRGGRLVQVQARREVIVCAGAVNSPQLLQLSGIGDPGALQRLGIASVCHAPMVGQGLQDHLHVTHHYRSRVPTLNQELGSWANRLWAGLRFVLTRQGPLSMSVNQAGGFVRADLTLGDPDLQLYFNPASYTTRAVAARTTMNPDPFAGFSMSVNACRPTSRGSVMLQSGDPFQPPLISPNYLSTEHDVAQALAGARLLRRLAATPPLSALIESEILPGRDKTTDAQLLADFRTRADTIFHPVGSCRMGPDARDAVVDARLRVYGVEGLRVVDASVFPAITSGNTNAPTFMVAEKGAQMILQDAGGKSA